MEESGEGRYKESYEVKFWRKKLWGMPKNTKQE
jgi:hypothetical protein